MQMTARRWAWVGAIVLCVGASAGAGFVVGLRWPIETVERWLLGDGGPERFGWTRFATTDFPRYEPIRVHVDSLVYIAGGFYSAETRATDRAEVLDLTSGRFSPRRPMPVPVTHQGWVAIRDTVWVAGGFEGDHPGPATDRVWRYAIRTDVWEEGPPLPAPRGSGALVARGDTLHFFGGFHPDRSSDSEDHWTLVVGDSTWRPAAPLPRPRGHLSAAVLGGRIYAISGNFGHDPIPIDVSFVDRYDPAVDRWEPAPPTPFSTTHSEPTTVAYDGGILLAGGRSIEESRRNRDDVLFFDPARSRWLHTGRTPVPMYGGVGTVWRDTLFVGMGAEAGNNPTNTRLWKRALRGTWWRADPMPVALAEVATAVIGETLFVVGQGSTFTLAYDLAAGRWAPPRTFHARPAHGHHYAAEVVDGRLFLLGGLGGLSEHGQVQIFDPQANRWALGPPMPFPAGSSASAVIDGKIYVAGGIVGDTTTARAAVLDPVTGEWESLPPMPLPRNHAASGTDGSRLYVFGGRGPGSGNANVVADGFADVQIYDPATGSWSVSDGAPGSPLPLPQARGGTGKAAFLDGEFWVIGGETLDGPGATEEGTYHRVDIYDPVRNAWRRGPDLPTARHGIFPLADAGRIIVAGGGTASGASASPVVEVLWPRPIRP